MAHFPKHNKLNFSGYPGAVYQFNQLGSTNSYLKQHIKSFENYAVIWALRQERGKGRFDRKWVSVSGKDLTFSALLPLAKLKQKLWQNITQITALAISELLEEFKLLPGIKWPNDVLIKNKKISGILCETVKSGNKSYAILGVGFNVNSNEMEIRNHPFTATSLHCELKNEFELEKLLEIILIKIFKNYEILVKHGFNYFSEKIKFKLAYKNQNIIFYSGNQKLSGKIIDLNPDGSLLFELDNSETITFHSGEIKSMNKRIYIPNPDKPELTTKGTKNTKKSDKMN